MPTALPSATPMVRRARAVLFAGAIGATAIGGSAACAKEPQGQPPQIPPQPAEPTAVAMYGAVAPPPEVDAGVVAVPPQPPQPAPQPTAVSMYGAPPPPRKP